jgi:hypothetical protein
VSACFGVDNSPQWLIGAAIGVAATHFVIDKIW